LVDARGTRASPISGEELNKLVLQTERHIRNPDFRRAAVARLKQAAAPDAAAFELDSCLAESASPINCRKRFHPDDPWEMQDFIRQLHANLAELSCGSADIARGIIRQILDKAEKGSTRIGLDAVMGKRLASKEPCPGLHGLGEEEKNRLRGALEATKKR
jgi:hypothetical protein